MSASEPMQWRSDSVQRLCGLAASSSSLSDSCSCQAASGSDSSVGVALGQPEPAVAALGWVSWVGGYFTIAVQCGLACIEILCHIQRMSRRLSISPLSGHNMPLVATGPGEAPVPAPQRRR